MCFSATASFAAGAALVAVGAVTISQARTRRQIPFAAVPLLFGVQQLTEGFVWLSLSSASIATNTLPVYVYYLFAHAWWPAYIPLAILGVEVIAWRKRAISLLEVLGLVVAAYYAVYMALAPIAAHIVDRCVVYSHPTSSYSTLIVLAYVLVTCGSCMLSSSSIIRMFGALTLGFLAIAAIFYYSAFVSVWCFFAAILSAIVWLYFKRPQHTRHAR